MKERVEGKKYPFIGYTVQGDGYDSKGRKVENPRVFGYPKKKPTKKGLSIKVNQVIGFGEVDYLEVVCYGSAFDEVKALNLTKGDLIDFYGRFEIEHGTKLDFEKVVINDPLQIRRFKGRAPTHAEL